MQAKDAKQGYPVYILSRKDITIKNGKVLNAPVPHFDSRVPGAAKMVVDLNVDVDGKQQTYVMDDTAEVGYVGDNVITLNIESIQRELESIKTQSEQALSMVDFHRQAVEKCDRLLKEYSPQYRERTEYAERIHGVEEKVSKLSDTLTAFLNKFEAERQL